MLFTGSFPLDHDGHCKQQMVAYMRCLYSNKDDNSACRILSKEYLECRMENNLMAKEDLTKLGFKDLVDEKEQTAATKS